MFSLILTLLSLSLCILNFLNKLSGFGVSYQFLTKIHTTMQYNDIQMSEFIRQNIGVLQAELPPLLFLLYIAEERILQLLRSQP